jgi:hypothetical protein
MLQPVNIPKWVLGVLNNLYDLERKTYSKEDTLNVRRNVERIKEIFQSESIFYEDPMGQKFSETRTDVDATISGESVDDLRIVEVIKPIIRCGTSSFSVVVQKGIVVVESSSVMKDGEQDHG